MAKSKVEKGGQKKATIYDIADRTGFSSGTVSRVLNNRSNVAADTRDRILKAARELNLRPQVSARLRQVAVVADPGNEDRVEGYAATMMSHLSYALSKRGFAVSFPEDPVNELPAQFIDGIVAVTYDSRLSRFLEEMESKVPVVYMDKFDCSPGQYAVCSDHYAAGSQAAEHFVARGKSKLAFFAQKSLPNSERLRGYKDGMERSGISMDSFRLLLEEKDALLAGITRIVRSGADSLYIPGASFQAMECLHVLSYVMGVRVPEDISIIGGENAIVSRIMSPPLTSIGEPLQNMATEAASMLEVLLQGGVLEKNVLQLPVRLIERNSVLGG